ncbi:hypothetical protein [Amycolatopsis sp.]|uniref:hypothetical protein n=1 Tax=Amycolatopsis sp. TaxID=37632 RepID=UPI002D7E47B4|nr:hypothetical protein [Amycolatopsis sp.]HET6705799.1 hypothetical protein [Amycolatopsis sp.]
MSVDFSPIAELLMDRPPAVLAVRPAADGSYPFTARADVAAVSPGRLVFDPGFRYPGRPRPGLPRPAGTEPTGAPTDPAVVAEVTRLTSEFAELYARHQKGVRRRGWPGSARPSWPPPKSGSGLLGPYCHDSLGRLVDNYLEGEPGSCRWEDDPDDDGVVFETPPAGQVKRLSRNDWWVTFGTDLAGNYLLVDLDRPPGPARPHGAAHAAALDPAGPRRIGGAGLGGRSATCPPCGC